MNYLFVIKQTLRFSCSLLQDVVTMHLHLASWQENSVLQSIFESSQMPLSNKALKKIMFLIITSQIQALRLLEYKTSEGTLSNINYSNMKTLIYSVG